MKTVNKLWIGLCVLILLAPLGLIIPSFFKAGAAWGEWGTEDLKGMLGYIPKGLQRLSEIWTAPFPDYEFKGSQEKGIASQGLAYIFSALIGILATTIAVYIFAKFALKKNDKKKSGRIH